MGARRRLCGHPLALLGVGAKPVAVAAEGSPGSISVRVSVGLLGHLGDEDAGVCRVAEQFAAGAAGLFQDLNTTKHNVPLGGGEAGCLIVGLVDDAGKPLTGGSKTLGLSNLSVGGQKCLVKPIGGVSVGQQSAKLVLCRLGVRAKGKAQSRSDAVLGSGLHGKILVLGY